MGESLSKAIKDLNMPEHADAEVLTSFARDFESAYELASQHKVTKEEDER